MSIPNPSPQPLFSQPLGELPDGRPVEAWTLAGQGGLMLEVLTYGGIVRRLFAPDRDGDLADMVLGYDDLAGYLGDPFYMGATAGRIAGRVTNGQLKVEGEVYDLVVNNPPNHLHGGPKALHSRLWTAEPLERDDGAPSLKLEYTSPDGEEGYPGEARISVIYTVSADNTFHYETQVETDRPTPVSLTHHSYFNLEGEGSGTILKHRMQVHSSEVAECDAAMTLLNRLQPVDGTAADLQAERTLKDVVPNVWQQHGDLYWLGDSADLKPAARVMDPSSGRILEVKTTQSCLQTYFGAGFQGALHGKSGTAYPCHAGFCLECEGYPEASNTEGFGDILVRPGQPQYHKTTYAFSTSTR